MTEENRAPPRHQYRPGCRMSADRALARHVGVAAFIVNNNPETMEGSRRLFPTPVGCPSRRLPELARMVGRPHPSRRAHARLYLRDLFKPRAPQDKDGWAYAESRLVTEPFAVVHYLTMSNSPRDGLSASKSPSYPPLRDRLGRRPRCEDGDSLAQLHFVVKRRGRDVVAADGGTERRLRVTAAPAGSA